MAETKTKTPETAAAKSAKAAPKTAAAKKATAAKTTKATTKPKQPDWRTQVYDPEGKWCGFFMDDETARKWVGKREGYEITDRKPERKQRIDPESSSDETPTAEQPAESQDDETNDES